MGDFEKQMKERASELKRAFKKGMKAVGPPCKKGMKVVGAACKKGWNKVRNLKT